MGSRLDGSDQGFTANDSWIVVLGGLAFPPVEPVPQIVLVVEFNETLEEMLASDAVFAEEVHLPLERPRQGLRNAFSSSVI